MSRSPFVYPPDGSVIVCGDGPELFVFGGQNDGPLWKKFCDGVLVAVDANIRMVVSLDSDGRLIQWRANDGYKEEETTLDAPGVSAVALRPDGTCAVIATDAVVLTSARGGGRTIPAPGVTVVAWSPDGKLAIGTASGDFQVLDPAGKPLGNCPMGAAITGIAWRAPSQWLVAAGTRVTLVATDGKLASTVVEVGGATGAVACSGDGAIFAVMTGAQAVAIGEFANNRTIGNITFQRDVAGLGFGRETWLAIGVDEACANRVDLLTGQTTRTEPHIGRAAQKWSMKVEVEPMLVRQASTTVRTAGKAIAEYIDHSGGDGGWGCLKSCLIFLAISMFCGGCSGILGAIGWYLNSQGMLPG